MAFSATQVVRFRRAWFALHILAAAAATRYISPRQLATQLRTVHAYVQDTCAKCAERFQAEVATILAHDPTSVERVMYDIHVRASDTAQEPPSFGDVQNHHRAALRNALRSDRRASSRLVTLGEATAEGCDAVHMARLKYELSTAVIDTTMRGLR